MRRYLDGRAMDDVAMDRLRAHEEAALAMHAGGFFLAHSGGKDSTVIHDLAKRAGVRFEAHHNLTTVDAPELVRFVRSLGDIQIDRPPKTMWQLIRENNSPPRRTARYCCRELKEIGGTGRLVITGVRWAESPRRSKRRMVEACYRDKTRRFIHPIIDWSTADVWQYIRERGLPYCCLYAEGLARVGCVLCPMTRNVEWQMARWPKLCAAWERAIKATYREGHVGRHGTAFRSAEEYWRWWLDRDAPSPKAVGEPVLFEDDPSAEEARHA